MHNVTMFVFMVGCRREVKAKGGDLGERLRLMGVGWSVMSCQCADETVLLA